MLTTLYVFISSEVHCSVAELHVLRDLLEEFKYEDIRAAVLGKNSYEREDFALMRSVMLLNNKRFSWLYLFFYW